MCEIDERIERLTRWNNGRLELGGQFNTDLLTLRNAYQEQVERCRTAALILQQRDKQIAAYAAEIERLKEREAELKRGLCKNNTEFQLAFLDAYLDKFRGLTTSLTAADALDKAAIDVVRLRESTGGNSFANFYCAVNRLRMASDDYTATRPEADI